MYVLSLYIYTVYTVYMCMCVYICIEREIQFTNRASLGYLHLPHTTPHPTTPYLWLDACNQTPSNKAVWAFCCFLVAVGIKREEKQSQSGNRNNCTQSKYEQRGNTIGPFPDTLSTHTLRSPQYRLNPLIWPTGQSGNNVGTFLFLPFEKLRSKFIFLKSKRWKTII